MMCRSIATITTCDKLLALRVDAFRPAMQHFCGFAVEIYACFGANQLLQLHEEDLFRKQKNYVSMLGRNEQTCLELAPSKQLEALAGGRQTLCLLVLWWCYTLSKIWETGKSLANGVYVSLSPSLCVLAGAALSKMWEMQKELDKEGSLFLLWWWYSVSKIWEVQEELDKWYRSLSLPMSLSVCWWCNTEQNQREVQEELEKQSHLMV